MTAFPVGSRVELAPNRVCRRCAWCTQDHEPRRRGYELVCPHGYGCCQNCATCSEHGTGRVIAVHTRNHWTTVEVQLDRTGDLHTFHSSDLRRVAA